MRLAFPPGGRTAAPGRRRPGRARPPHSRAPLALAALLAAAGCDAGAPDGATTFRDSADVRIALSPAADRPLPWRFEPDFTLGGAASGPESFASLTVSNVAVGPGGRIHVLDQDARVVQVFSADGDWLASVGGGGEDGGVLAQPYSLTVTADGGVWIYDVALGALVGFGPGGEPLPRRPGILQPPPNTQRHLHAVPEGLLVNLLEGEASRSNTLARLTERDTVALTRVDIPDFRITAFPSCPGVSLRLPPLFWQSLAWDHRDGVTAVSARPAYVVDFYEGVFLKRSVRRELGVRAATPELAEAELGGPFELDLAPGFACSIPAAEMVDGRGVAPFVPWIGGVALSGDGELWVRRHEVGSETGGPVDVFGGDGAYLGTLSEGPGLPVLFLPDGRVGFVDYGEAGADRLVVMRVVREGQG